MELFARLTVPRHEVRVVGLVCTGHFFSHFYLLLVPPLFPVLRDVYGVGFTELGFATACFSIASGFTQIPVGFMVDRYGARQILVWGLLLESIAIALIGVFPIYAALVALMVAAGLCNSVFHPADYAILNATVDKSRIGRVFSLHTFTGYLGDALAPATVLALTFLFDWRVALFICGFLGVLVALAMWMNAAVLTNDTGRGRARGFTYGKDEAGRHTGIALLVSVPVLMAFVFFASMSLSGGGVRSFGIATLHEMYGMSLGEAGMAVTVYLLVSPVGVLVGGHFADRIVRHDLAAATCMAVIAACVFTVAAFEPPLAVVTGLFAIAGFANGFLAPPRDMIVRSLAAPSDMGKVFGFVSAGFAVSGIVGPILYGWVLDHADARNVFWASGFIALLTIATVLGPAGGRRAAVRS